MSASENARYAYGGTAFCYWPGRYSPERLDVKRQYCQYLCCLLFSARSDKRRSALRARHISSISLPTSKLSRNGVVGDVRSKRSISALLETGVPGVYLTLANSLFLAFNGINKLPVIGGGRIPTPPPPRF